MKTKILFAVSLLVALLAATLQSVNAEPVFRMNIPFQFTVEGKVFPAGRYDFTRNAGQDFIEIRAVAKGPAANALVLTRLAAGIHTTPKDAHAVFDKIGDTYTLSEFWIPNMDGFLLHIAKEKHEHKIIDTSAQAIGG